MRIKLAGYNFSVLKYFRFQLLCVIIAAKASQAFEHCFRRYESSLSFITMGSLSPSPSSLFILPPLLHYKITPTPHIQIHTVLRKMARIDHNQQLAILRSENENLRNLNDRLIQDLVEKNGEIANLLKSKKYLVSVLARSYRDKAELVAELEAMRLASKGSTVKMAEMKLELEALHRSVGQAQKKSFWTLALSGTAIIAAVASFAYFSARGNA